MALTALNVHVFISNVEVYGPVNVVMDDRRHRLTVKDTVDGRYGEVASFEGVEMTWRKQNLESQYTLADGRIIQMLNAAGCGCNK